MGVMQEIRVHLSRGRTSGELIGMGYAPGTVYRLQREYRDVNQHAPDVPDLTGHLSFFENRDGMSAVWHPESSVMCPGCGEDVSHWQMCTHCNRLIPEGCNCSLDSLAIRQGFSFLELIEGGNV